jgi:Flp pilus assembly protein TadG
MRPIVIFERARAARDRGAAAVEFALMIPILLSLVMGMIDFAWYFYVDHVITNAAREGARAGTLWTRADDGNGEGRLIPDATQTATTHVVSAGLSSAKVTVTVPPVTPGLVEEVKVTVAYPVGSVSGFFGTTLLPANATATSVMRRQK